VRNSKAAILPNTRSPKRQAFRRATTWKVAVSMQSRAQVGRPGVSGTWMIIGRPRAGGDRLVAQAVAFAQPMVFFQTWPWPGRVAGFRIGRGPPRQAEVGTSSTCGWTGSPPHSLVSGGLRKRFALGSSTAVGSSTIRLGPSALGDPAHASRRWPATAAARPTVHLVGDIDDVPRRRRHRPFRPPYDPVRPDAGENPKSQLVAWRAAQLRPRRCRETSRRGRRLGVAIARIGVDAGAGGRPTCLDVQIDAVQCARSDGRASNP
jgi:hypothetical protein